MASSTSVRPPSRYLANCNHSRSHTCSLVFDCPELPLTTVILHQFLPCHLGPPLGRHSINLYKTCCPDCTTRALHISIQQNMFHPYLTLYSMTFSIFRYNNIGKKIKKNFSKVLKCSIFHNIFKYIVFQRHRKVLLWSRGLRSLFVLGNSLEKVYFGDFSMPLQFVS